MKEIFEEKMRSQMMGHEVTPPTHVWENIQKRTQKGAGFAAGFRNWAKMSAVAILTLGTGTALYLVNAHLSQPSEIQFSDSLQLTDSIYVEDQLLGASDQNTDVEVAQSEAIVNSEETTKMEDHNLAVVSVETSTASNNTAEDDTKLAASEVVKKTSISMSDIKVKTLTNSNNPEVLLSCTNLMGSFDKVVWSIPSLNIEAEGFEITEQIQNGTFTVELVAYIDGKIIDRKQTKINVGGAPYMSQLKYSFSPNNDGVKDVYIIEANNVEKALLEIRKDGEVVFSKTSLPLMWDGSAFNGDTLPQGYYDVFVKLTSPDGETLEKATKVKLSR